MHGWRAGRRHSCALAVSLEYSLSARTFLRSSHAAQSREVFVAYAAACSITTSAPAPHRRLAVGQTVYLSQEQALGLTEVRSQDERGILGRDSPVAKVSGAALIIARARGAVENIRQICQNLAKYPSNFA